MKKANGIIIPAITPFDERGELRLDYLEKNYQRWNQSSVQGCMALGSNGEFRSLDDDEAFEVLKTVSEVIADDKVYIAGIGRESLYQTLKFLDRLMMADVKIDYVSVLTPHYFKELMSDDAMYGFFTKVADESAYPVLLYCAPGFANNVCVSPGVLRRLADHPNIVGIKDTSKDMMNAYMDAVGGREDFDVLAGSLGTIITCMERGGRGGIVSAANYFPNACGKLYQIAAEQGMDVAKTYHAKIKQVAAQTGGRTSVAGVKAVMGLMGYNSGVPRKPILPCTEQLMEEFKKVIRENEDILADDMP